MINMCDTLEDFQEQCYNCKYCDEEARGKIVACCTFGFKLSVSDKGVCLTRREKD